MRKWVLALAVVGAFAVDGTATAADGPVRSEAVFDAAEPGVYAECDGFDVVLSEMHIERRLLTWYEEGAPVLERRHVSFVGTFANELTGKSGTFSGRFERVEDFAVGTVTLSGLVRQVRVPGEPVLVATGIDVTDTDESLLFQAGHTLGAWEEQLCAFMA